jgi:hypothetical protein
MDNNSKSRRSLAEDFPIFMEEVLSRAIEGAKTYGDHSYDRPKAELIDEIMQECADVCGWSFILWARLFHMKHKLSELSCPPKP